MNTIVARNISKTIRGTKVLQGINLSLEGGKVYSFQGINGCGKTMLFRVLSGLTRPTTGEIYYNDIDFQDKNRPMFKIGITLEGASMYPGLTGTQNLSYLAGINRLVGQSEIRDAICRVGLNPDDTRTFRKYSLGMKQRLLLAQAIMEKPDFLFLDEPTNAIDKEGVAQIHEVIRQEAERGAVVLLASHIDGDVASLADKCYQMHEGVIDNA